jgi:hypothetical protein
LKIGLEKGRNFSLSKPLEAEIVLPALAGLELSSASQGDLKGFNSEKDVTIDLSDSSRLKGSLGAEKAILKIGGASSISLTGTAQSARISAEGSSHLTLPDFLIKQCELDLDGASTAEITLRSTAPFVAKLSGSSIFKGNLDASNIDLEAEGATRATLRGSGKSAKIRLKDSSHLESSELVLDAKTVELKVSGASSGALNGTSDSTVVEASGVSHLALDGLKTKTADVTLSGVSHAKVAVSSKLKYHISGVSHLTYTGDPSSVDGESSSGSHISHE